MLEGESVERPGGSIQITVGGAPSCDKQNGIDNVWEDADLCVADGQDEWRSGRIASAAEEVRIIVRHDEADHEDGEDVEEEDTPEDTLDGFGDVLAGVLDLADGDTDDLSSCEGEGGLNKNIPEGEEAPEGSADAADWLASDRIRRPEELGHRAWVLPVAETDAVTGGTATEVDDERGDDQDDNGDDLDETEPKLGLTIVLDTEEVDAEYEDEENRDPSGRIDACVPVLDDDGGGRDFGWKSDAVRVPVRPAQGETETWVEEASGVVGESAWDCEKSADLAEGDHHGVDHDTHDHVGDKGADRASGGQRATKTDKETSADGSSQCNHGEMTLLHISLDMSIAGLVVHTEASQGFGVVIVGSLGGGLRGGVGALLHIRREDSDAVHVRRSHCEWGRVNGVRKEGGRREDKNDSDTCRAPLRNGPMAVEEEKFLL